MGKDSALYQLMGVRMNGVMNGIISSDGEYQAIIRKSDEYSGRLAKMEHFHLPHPCRAEDHRRIFQRPLRVIENGVEDFLRHRVYLPVLHQRRPADAFDTQAIFQPCRDRPRPGLVIALVGVGGEVP